MSNCNFHEPRCQRTYAGKVCGKPATTQGISTAWFCDEHWDEVSKTIEEAEQFNDEINEARL
jgi:hypothetical protein